MRQERDTREGESCHAEYNEASRPAREILRFAQDDNGAQDDNLTVER
jgi:hypothetical protein